MFTFPILFMKGLVGKWMWMDGLGMKQNRTNGLGFLLVGCFDLASLHSLYSYVFFSFAICFMQRNCLLYTKIVFFYIRTQR